MLCFVLFFNKTVLNRVVISQTNNFELHKTSQGTNIAMSDESPDLQRARKAASLACLDSFIDNLPMGYYSKIGVSGIELSGGQKQRLLIARAIYRDPALLVLDEATSSLDAINEARIVRNLKDNNQG